MKKVSRRVTLIDACAQVGLERTRVLTWIEREWISPPEANTLDEEDLARIHLIQELENDFGVNEAAIPLILHLVDQLCYFRDEAEHREKNLAPGSD